MVKSHPHTSLVPDGSFYWSDNWLFVGLLELNIPVPTPCRIVIQDISISMWLAVIPCECSLFYSCAVKPYIILGEIRA